SFHLATNMIVATAYFDAASFTWKLGSPGVVTPDGLHLQAETTHTGVTAFVIPDAVNPPPMPAPDQPLGPSPDAAIFPPASTNLTLTPEGIYPDQKALVQANFAGAQIR